MSMPGFKLSSSASGRAGVHFARLRGEPVLFRFDEADRSQGSRQLETGMCAAASGARLVDGGPGVSRTDYPPKARTNQGLGPRPSCAVSYQIGSSWQAAKAWPLVAGV